jgi:hypothetical protein
MFIYAAPVNRTRGSAYKCVGMLTKLWADCVPHAQQSFKEITSTATRSPPSNVGNADSAAGDKGTLLHITLLR